MHLSSQVRKSKVKDRNVVTTDWFPHLTMNTKLKVSVIVAEKENIHVGEYHYVWLSVEYMFV